MVKTNKSDLPELALRVSYTCWQEAAPIFDNNNCWILPLRVSPRNQEHKKTIAYKFDSFYTDINKEDDIMTLEWFLKSMKMK